MPNPTYSLAWPRRLFEWEAERVAALSDDVVPEAVALLADEAFADSGARDDLQARIGEDARVWADPAAAAREWLAQVKTNLREYRAPQYFAEREGFVAADAYQGRKPLYEAFVDLAREMQDRGYFPVALPRECVDEEVDYGAVTWRLQRATKLTVEWPLHDDGFFGPPSESTLFSVIEYFHDYAQRPRTEGYVHRFNECGAHYSAHNREAGGVVYRWRVNELLKFYGVDFSLGSTGDERGRVIRTSPSPIRELADAQVRAREASPEDEVAHAIRSFRSRHAGVAEKRSAIRALSHALEPRRKEIAARITKGDESDLFQIVNRFGIRHNNPSQLVDYGDEHLDWIFWMHLATIELLDRLERRDSGK